MTRKSSSSLWIEERMPAGLDVSWWANKSTSQKLFTSSASRPARPNTPTWEAGTTRRCLEEEPSR